MTDRRRIGIGLISAGWMGMLHSTAYRAVRETWPDLGVDPDLVIVADPIEVNAHLAAERFGYRETTADIQAVLNHPDVDAVSICAPNFLHREFALAAAAAGKPFWIEKPMGASVAQSREIADAVESAGLITAVGFNYRHAPAVAHVRRLVREGALGDIRSVRVWLNADYSAAPDGPRTWRFVKEMAGTGVLGDLLSHGFDLAQYLVGPIVEVTSATRTFITERPAPGRGVGHSVTADSDAPPLPVENEDYASVLARFQSGAMGTFESSRIAIGSRCDYGFELSGSLGAARWNFERMNEVEVCLSGELHYGFTRVMTEPGFGEFGRFQPGAGMGLSFDDLKTIEAKLFLESILTGRQLAPSVADGLVAAGIVSAAAASAEDGRWHDVPVPTGRTTFDA
ncbi:Predicted dehydrogenase [Tessaracoccus bendigoensis DSM 12906]|uniref:Predicted dehydrogenase n=1 Tax=Tessaracoccus bendigoensis DSM 12906 TaxID=1123357 RepID=A0A1M6ESX5_9ACTN|nr:Gfo/Idh/MocA family oxidoreductase [Tessaracoccus bendigoensis]SHI88567.1 Predicted dehydrogenase [Tessaracoccus bendigoensis DSM 12906]